MTTKSPLNSPHYVCMGCRAEANELIKCPTPGCPRHRNPLSPCGCKNGKHTKIPKLNRAGFAEKTKY